MKTNKPKTWKDFQKRAKKSPPPVIHQPSPPPAISPAQIAAQEAARKAMRKIVEAARCPICEGQLENGIRPDVCKMQCAWNSEHYTAVFKAGIEKPTHQELLLTSERDGYQVMCELRDDGQYEVSVYLLDMTLTISRMRDKKRVASFVADVSPAWCRSYEVFARKFELLEMLS